MSTETVFEAVVTGASTWSGVGSSSACRRRGCGGNWNVVVAWRKRGVITEGTSRGPGVRSLNDDVRN